MNCIGTKSTPTSKSFNNITGMSNVNSSDELQFLYKKNTPFWKRKCFILISLFVSTTLLGLLTFYLLNDIFHQGRDTPRTAHNNLNDTISRRLRVESPHKSEGSVEKSHVLQRHVRHFQTVTEDVHEQEISVTCELNNRIKELNNEIQRLYESLTRLDARVSRERRGLYEKTAVVDCVQMKGKFNKIYEDLSRISEALSMVDDNGICRCKCPLDSVAIVGTRTTKELLATHLTEKPFKVTTFASRNVDGREPDAGEKTKQLKKNLIVEGLPANEFGSVTASDYEIVGTTPNDQNEIATTLSSSLVGSIITTREDTAVVRAVDTKWDLSPEMSNAVTNFVKFNDNDLQTTTEPQTIYYDEIVTNDYRNTAAREHIIVTSGTPKSSTDIITDSDQIIETKENVSTSTAQDENMNKDDVILRGTTTGAVNENISKLATTTDVLQKHENNQIDKYSTGKTSESTSKNENISASTTEISELDDNRAGTIVAKETSEWTSAENENMSKPTTDLSARLDNDRRDDPSYATETTLEPTSENEIISGSVTVWTTPKLDDNNNNYYYSNADGPEIITVGFTIEKKNVSETTTKMPTITATSDNKNNEIVSKDRSSSASRNEGRAANGPEVERNNTVGPTAVNKKDDNGSVPRRPEVMHVQQQVVQPKWYPVCFYPVPCSPNAPNYLQPNGQEQDAAKSAIRYSAQSLSAYKRRPPPVATVIQNNYPIMSYCATDMVCSVADVAAQSNVLHCMLKPMFSVDVNVNGGGGGGGSVDTSNRTVENRDDSAKNAVAAMAKSARNDGDILTGNLDCPPNTLPCVDNSGCVDTENWCDGRIHCNDASDESQCNCKQRIDKDKLCDGYYDCPSGEDELGCFGCNNQTFSCGDWDVIAQRSSCFERHNRCDYVQNCPNGRDEDECTLLSRHLENPNQMFFISYSSGYLHHNWKGNWYPMCGNDQTDTWAENACTVESGGQSKPNKIRYMNELTTYDGRYINIDGKNQITLLNTCKQQGIFVECEPEICGIRSDLKFNKNIDPDRLKRSPHSEPSNNVTSRFVRSKDPRVVGGFASNPGAWPWLIALYQDGIFHCGGVILSEQWVLTAAHCVNQYKKHFYEVQAGILRRFSFSPMEQSRIVTHAIVHTQYSRSTMENDLAVLRLDRGLEFNRWIRPVCLPDNKLSWIPFPGTICTAVGWGATVEHGPDPDNMREVEVPILAECTHKSDIDGREICAGYLSGGHDTCQGDSGGPLLCREPSNLNKWYVAGIVSHGEGCARPMEPGVYTRVALFMDWIVKVTEENNLPQDRPLQQCPGIRCKTGKQCIPAKRQCDKYVDCMNAEDERNCDYTGSQYNVNLYRSRNTDHSTLKYSKLLKNAGQPPRVVNSNSTVAGPKRMQTTVTFVSEDATPLPKVRDRDVVKVESRTEIKGKNATTSLDVMAHEAIRILFDNQFSEQTFSCKRITQVVLSKYRCDGTVDCEDGTDEQSCDCKTRLANMYNSSAICDGIMDCRGGTDEVGCSTVKCKSDESACEWPKKCIKRTSWCDGHKDCADGSDENYCVAITNGTSTTVTSDATGRPTLLQSGMVAVNRKGVWRVRCVDEDTISKIAHETCFALSFSLSKYHDKRLAWNSPLPLNTNKLKLTDMCQGLYVVCGARKAVNERLYHWHADIVVDGELARPGVLLKDSWVLIKRTCLNLSKTYVTAVLGGSAYSVMRIKSPYEQIIRIDGIREVSGTDFDLLHLANPATATRGVAPLSTLQFQPALRSHDTCYTIGYSDDRHVDKPEIALLRPDTRRCDDPNSLCFTVSQTPRSCLNGKNMSHVTAVICESDFGLFLAAPVIQPVVNLCDRKALVRLSVAEDFINEIAVVTDESVKTTSIPFCDGKRCQLGECVPWERVCDGIPDCRDEQDETIQMCGARSDKCKTNHTLCICNVGSFRCANGKCVEKSAFCDGFDHCGDGTDEPKTCQTNTCVDYLNLTAPERLCDGRWDCLDKSDDEFANCPGYCNRTNVYHCRSSNKCVSLEMVCDGEEDCPESDDEIECIGLITPAGKKNEGVLAVRSYGKWHEQCITDDYTNVDYHSVCVGLGFKHAVGIRKAAGTGVDFENFTVVQLNAVTDVVVRSATKDILQRRTDRPCTATYIVCSTA